MFHLVSVSIFILCLSLRSFYNVSATHHVIFMRAFIESDGSICVKCSFANGSDALGCEVEFRDRITDKCEPCIRYTIYRILSSSSAFKCISHAYEGNFSVVAYDKDANKTSWLRAAVYNDLPEFLLVSADNDEFSTSVPLLNVSTTTRGKLKAKQYDICIMMNISSLKHHGNSLYKRILI